MFHKQARGELVPGDSVVRKPKTQPIVGEVGVFYRGRTHVWPATWYAHAGAELQPDKPRTYAELATFREIQHHDVC